MHAVFCVFFIFALGVQHELLEDVIIPCDDAVHNKFNQPKFKNNNNNLKKIQRNRAASKRTLF
jgi:hypothetical protein